jgi:hypothetical protein
MTSALVPLKEINLKPTREKSALSIHLTFQTGPHRSLPIECELSSADAMHLLSALQSVQRNTGWRVPQFFSRRGKPKLRVVKDDSSL